MPGDGTSARALHQHDLSQTAAAEVVRSAAPRAGDTVLEVGAGTGNLTAALLAAGATVHAIELDRHRCAHLRQRFASALHGGQLRLHPGDARHLAPALPSGWRVVANPPFNRTAELLRRWLLDDLPGGPPARLDLVLQAQVVDKCSAPVGAATRWSVLARLHGRCWPGPRLDRAAVSPPSHVPLRLLTLQRAAQAPPPAELALVDRLLALAFAGPHTVRQAVRGCATPGICTRQGRLHGWDPQAHPRTVPAPAWLELARFLHGIGRL